MILFDIMEIPEHLVRQMSKGKCILFIGAGISIDAGLPSWSDLLDNLLKYCEKNKIIIPDLSEVKEMVRKGFYPNAVDQIRERIDRDNNLQFHHLIEELTREKTATTDIHKIITKLPISTILTTNYDELIERAYNEYTDFYVKNYSLVGDAPVLVQKSIQQGEKLILHVHGMFGNPNSMILSTKNYNEAEKCEASNRILQNLFSNNTVLFIGVSLKEPDILFLLDELNKLFGKTLGGHYALMSSKSAKELIDRSYKSLENISIIPYEGDLKESVDDFLENLLALIEKFNSFKEIGTEAGDRIIQDYIRDPKLSRSLTLIRNVMKNVWANDAPRIVRDCKDHGEKNSDRIAGFIEKLLKVNSRVRFSEYEIYLLLAGIYLHDIGMQCDIVQFPEVKKRAESLGAKFDVKFTAKRTSSYSLEEQNEIRKNRHYLSAAWIGYLYEANNSVFSPSIQSIPVGLVNDVMDICKFHSKLHINDCPDSFFLYPNHRKKIVAALLLFADELDIYSSRVDLETVKIFTIKPEDSLYWWLHNYTNITFIGSNKIRLTIGLCPNDFELYGSFIREYYISNYKKKIQPVLDVLIEHKIPIVIDNRSDVVKNEFAEKLPLEITNILYKKLLSQAFTLENIGENKEATKILNYIANNKNKLNDDEIIKTVNFKKNALEKRDKDKKTDILNQVINVFQEKKEGLFKSITSIELQFKNFISSERSIPEDFFSFLSILRKWNSYTPILPSEKGDNKGGGYFLFHHGKGIVIDPGFNFIENFYQEGFKVADIDAVLITHAHNDHTVDLESILTLVYKHNDSIKDIVIEETKGKNEDETRQEIKKRLEKKGKKIDLFMNVGTFMKYSGWLNLKDSNEINSITVLMPETMYKLPEEYHGITIYTTRAKHHEVIDDQYAIGFILDINGIKVGFTGDTGWDWDRNETMVKPFKEHKPRLVVAHLGSIKSKEFDYVEATGDAERNECFYAHHLGLLGITKFLDETKPDLTVVSEFGEELRGIRKEIVESIGKVLGLHCLPGDIGLYIKLEDLSVYCFIEENFVDYSKIKVLSEVEDDESTLYFHKEEPDQNIFIPAYNRKRRTKAVPLVERIKPKRNMSTE